MKTVAKKIQPKKNEHYPSYELKLSNMTEGKVLALLHLIEQPQSELQAEVVGSIRNALHDIQFLA